MAIQKPYNISVNGKTIDGNEDNIISWNGSGDISTAFQVKIFNNVGTMVYDSTKTTSYSLSFTLPAKTITNGNVYTVTITVFNSANQSATSDQVIFQTSSRPVVTLDALSNPIGNQSYNFSAEYSQAENIPLESYVVLLYDSNQNLIAQSNVLTDTPIEYLFTGLQSGYSYYIEFQCTSTKGLVGTTGKVSFNVLYAQPSANLSIDVQNNEDTAGISFSWNVQQILGTTDTGTFINNEELDVTHGKAWFSDGFSVDNDFTLKCWLSSPVHNVNLLTIGGTNGEITVQYQDDNRFHAYKQMYANADLMAREHYCTDVVNGTNYFLLIQQIGSNINITSQVVS